MLPQPPASVDAPPASKAARLSRRKWMMLKVVGITSVLGCMLLTAAPILLYRRCRCGGPRFEAVHNLRQIGLALFEFETEYGGFPDATTSVRVSEATGSTLSMGSVSSNDFLCQLLASGIVASETMFFVRGPGMTGPDNIFTPGEALKKGECSFTYFLGATIVDNPERPLVVAPMIAGADRFDRKAFEGKAVILKLDNSVMSCDIDRHGHVIFKGRNLMDPHHPVWEGKPPVIAWQE